MPSLDFATSFIFQDVLKKNSNIYSVSGHDAEKCVSYSQLKAKFAGYKPYYMYRQKNTVGNLENVGFSIEGHEGLYNVYMMEGLHTVIASGAGASTKLVSDDLSDTEKIYNPKYPFEYLKDKENIMSYFICPICGQPLNIKEKSYV